MVPSSFIFLNALPLTPNGKIDRDILPRPESAKTKSASERIPPRTETEKIIANIWTEVLHIDEVGVHDDFFEIGGHSLLAAQVMNRLRDNFELEIPLSRIFEYPTVGGIAGYVDAAVWSTRDTLAAGHSKATDFEKGEL
jgi:acyl carrier protein